jgi:hypothetical protein
MPRIRLAVLGFLLSFHPVAFGFQLSPQELLAKLDTADFAKILNDVLATVKIGTAPQIDSKTGAQWGPSIPVVFLSVPSLQNGPAPSRLFFAAAGYCSLSKMLYRCEWETKPNKHSTAVLQDELSARVSAVLPKTWRRENGQDEATRFVEFTDPTGEVSVTVACPVSDDRDVLTGAAFTARLTIHSPKLPGARF